MAAAGIKHEMRNGVRVLTLAHPPSNALAVSVRRLLLAAVSNPGDECRAIVLAGQGATFSSALALEPDTATPTLYDLCQAIATAPVPVVAALHGLVMGPGAEVALAAQARIAAPGCRIAFAEIALGLCPAGGASLRLPALIGAAAALRLLLTGRAVPLDEALALSLVDVSAEGDLLANAVALAEGLTEAPTAPRRAEPATAYQAAVAAARRAHPKALPALGRIIDCVEAALLLRPEAALAYECVAREDLEATPEAAALRSATRAERRAATLPPAVARSPGLLVDRIGVSGADPALLVVARAALARGVPVTWLSRSEDEAASLPDLDGRGGLLTRTRDPEDMAQMPFQVLSAAADGHSAARSAPGAAILRLGGGDGEMGLVIAPSARASELSILTEEAPDAISTAVAGLRRIGLPPVLVGLSPVLGQRVARAGEAAMAHLLTHGLSATEVAAALQPFGSLLPRSLMAGSGVTGSKPPAGPALTLTKREIRNRWLGAMANEALRLLDQGIARRPSDVDHAMIAGHGFPRWRGGPMHQADLRGLLVLRHDLRLWADDNPIWSPAPLLDRLIQDGIALSVLDG